MIIKQEYKVANYANIKTVNNVSIITVNVISVYLAMLYINEQVYVRSQSYKIVTLSKTIYVDNVIKDIYYL